MVLRSAFRYGSVPPIGTSATAKTPKSVTFARTSFQRRSSFQDVPEVEDTGSPTQRDGWSAYRISNAALDEFDDLAYTSKRKDADFLSEANRCVDAVDALAALPIRRPRYKVPAAGGQTKLAAAKERPVIANPPGQAKSRFAAAPPAVRKAYIDRKLGREPPTLNDCDTTFNYQLTSVTSRGDLLKAENKLLATQPADFDAPSTVSALKARLREASDLASRQKLLLDRYVTDPAADEAKRQLNKILTGPEQRQDGSPNKARAGSEPPKISPVRSHLRDVLRRCGNNYAGDD